MKILPTQTERTTFLWLILVFMAMLIPQCWWTIRWSGNTIACSAWMLVFANILFLVSVIAGTKRQIVIWLVSMLSLLTAYLFTSTPKPDDDNRHWYHLGAEWTGLVNPSEAIFWLAVLCLFVFAFSFAMSWLLDRIAAPVNGMEKKQRGTEEQFSSEQKTQKSSGRIRLLIVAAAVLFLAQAASNVVKVSFGSINFGQSFLIPVMGTITIVLMCGFICRLRPLPAFGVGLLGSVALTGAGVAMAVQGGSMATPILLLGVFGYCAAILTVVFCFLGNSKQPFDAKPGWLSLVTATLACAIPMTASKYDLHTLLLSESPFDFAEAAFRKELNSQPGVEVTQTRFGGFSTRGVERSYELTFVSDDTEDFFNGFQSSGNSNSSCEMTILKMGPRVDLGDLKRQDPIRMQFYECELSSQQLADLAELDVPVSFAACSFKKNEIRQSNVSFNSTVSFLSAKSPTIEKFVDATTGIGFNAHLNLWNDNSISKQDMNALLNLLENSGSGFSVRLNAIGEAYDADDFNRGKNLERLEICSADFSPRKSSDGNSNDYFALLLNHEVKIEGRVVSDKLLWELALAAKGELRPIGFQNVLNPKLLFGTDSLNESRFVYRSNDSGEPEKLWLPQCSDEFADLFSKLQSLKALSFDTSWLGNQHLSGLMSSNVPLALNAEPTLNKLTNLQELYFSGNETVDLSLLSDLKNLKTIQFPSGSAGFSRELFPKLKEARIILDKPIKNGLMRELKAIDSLERLVVIDIYATNFSAAPFLKQAQPFFGDRVEIKVVDGDDSWQLAPDEFEQHRLEVRRQCIEKYLD